MLKKLFIFLSILTASLALTGGSAYASVGSFTASNVYYDTGTNVLTFDIASPSLSNLPANTLVLQNDNSNQIYDVSPSCTSNTGCSGTLTGVTGGGIVGDSVTIRVLGSVDEIDSQTLSYSSITSAPTPTPAPVIVNSDSQNSIVHLITSIRSGLISGLTTALPIVAVFVVTMSAIIFLWKLARHFIGQ